MPFFNEEDYNRMNRSKSEAPDGLIDGGGYLKIFTDFAESIRDLDPNDFNSKIKFMMDVVNPVYINEDGDVDKNYVFDLITCMSFHVIQLLLTGSSLHEDFKNNYIDILDREIIPTVTNECEGIPYWE
jgi:hypothetical protein